MQNKDIMSFGSESIYRAFEPKKWYESSHGVLVQKNGNCIRVELVTQFCLLRWICNFFKRFGVNLSEKLSFHKLIVCKVYSDPNSVYSDIQRDCVDNTTPIEDVITKITNIAKREQSVKTPIDPKKPLPEKTLPVLKKPDMTELPTTELPKKETLSLKSEKQVFELSSDEISHEIAKYSGKKTKKQDVAERLRKNAFFNRQQHLEEQIQNKTLFPTADVTEVLSPETFQTSTKDLYSAASTTQGRRSCNQDAFLMEPNTQITVGNTTTTAAVYGVFDGHGKGGAEAANYVRDHFIETFQSLLKNHKTQREEDQLFFTCKDTMQQLHVNYLKHIKAKGLPPGGTTAVVAMMINGSVWILNVGDSRAILVNKDGVVCQASTDAKPQDPRFLKKAKARGGTLDFYGVDRIGPIGLATPRAIGDDDRAENTKPIIAPNPKISRYPLEQFKGGHLVLACDGIWDVATSDQVGAVVHQESRTKKTLEDIALTIGKKALVARSSDNLTVVVAKLE